MKKFVKNKVDSFRLEPKPQTWENIEDSLDKKKRAAIWWFILPLTFIMGVGSAMLFQNINEDKLGQTGNLVNTEVIASQDNGIEEVPNQEVEINTGNKQENESNASNNIGSSQNNKAKIQKAHQNYHIKAKLFVANKVKDTKISNSANNNSNTTITSNNVVEPSSSTVDSMLEIPNKVLAVKRDSETEDTISVINSAIASQTISDPINKIAPLKISITPKTTWAIGVYGGLGMTKNFSKILENNTIRYSS